MLDQILYRGWQNLGLENWGTHQIRQILWNPNCFSTFDISVLNVAQFSVLLTTVVIKRRKAFKSLPRILFCHLVLAVTQLKGRRMNKSESFESVDYRGTNLYEENQDKVIKVLIFTASTWENITKRIYYFIEQQLFTICCKIKLDKFAT